MVRTYSVQAIREISKKCHQLLHQHNKESKAQSRILFRSKTQKDRKNCSKNFWRFAAQVLDEDKSSDDVDPKFSADVAEGYFKDVYRSEDREYHQPDWLPSPPSPPQQFTEELCPLTRFKMLSPRLAQSPPLLPLTK